MIIMVNIQQTIKNLIGMDVTNDFKNDVICAFDTTDKEVIVAEDESNEHITYQAYENCVGSPIICIKIKNDSIIDAWEA